jgi:hypothetical protein
MIAIRRLFPTLWVAVFVVGCGSAGLSPSVPAPTTRPTLSPASSAVRTQAPGTFRAVGVINGLLGGAASAFLADGQVLLAGGSDCSATPCTGSTTALLFDPATGSSHGTGELVTARAGARAVVLADGRVLVAGGVGCVSITCPAIASAEVYDPSSGKFAATGSLVSARTDALLVRLGDGRVFIVGGHALIGGQWQPVLAAELYDPASGKFAATGSLLAQTDADTATLLADGRVLVTANPMGRFSTSDRDEIWNPETGKFTLSGKVAVVATSKTATRLTNGQVLVAGGKTASPGQTGPSVGTAQLFDPATAQLALTGTMSTERAAHAAALLPDGRVLIVGGTDGTNVLASAEIFDPATGTFTPTGSMLNARLSPVAFSLPDGSVLIVGGTATLQGSAYPIETVEMYRP